MAIETNQEIARTFVQLTKRAESANLETLVQTFVDVGTLLPSITTNDNQIIFGRRGTGKTHALVYGLDAAKKGGAVAVYVDLRIVGSSGGLYTDPRLALSERATRLLIDVLEFTHDSLTTEALASSDLDLSIMGPLLDALGGSMTDVKVVGDVAVETQTSQTSGSEESSSATATLSAKPNLGMSTSVKQSRGNTENQKN